MTARGGQPSLVSANGSAATYLGAAAVGAAAAGRARRAGPDAGVMAPTLLGELDRYLFAQGTHRRLYHHLGAHPSDGGTFFGFSDPDGNTWAVQQLKVRAEKPLIPHEHRGRFGAE